MIRTIYVATSFTALTLALVPAQLICRALNLPLQRRIPQLWHRSICRLLGVRIHQNRQVDPQQPMLILANHVSWLDICVLGACRPVVFVAKSEVASWPLIGRLAKLQRTIFIDRSRKLDTGNVTQEIAEHLREGNAVVLFAEGTTSDNSRVLPFRSALVGAVHQAIGNAPDGHVTVQPLSLVYTQFGGVPVGRTLRDQVAWYGDTDLLPHMARIVSTGAIDATISWGKPAGELGNADRKSITREAERQVRAMTQAALRPIATQPS